jgi:hypothetical protein
MSKKKFCPECEEELPGHKGTCSRKPPVVGDPTLGPFPKKPKKQDDRKKHK